MWDQFMFYGRIYIFFFRNNINYEGVDFLFSFVYQYKKKLLMFCDGLKYVKMYFFFDRKIED